MKWAYYRCVRLAITSSREASGNQTPELEFHPQMAEANARNSSFREKY